MGNSQNPEETKKRYDELLQMMMPVYYIDKPMDSEMLSMAKKTWESVAKDTGRHFKQLKKDPAFKYEKCLDYFNEIFFVRLFDVHPMAKVLFHKSNSKQEKASQNKFLARMLTMALLDIDDQSRWDMTFTKLAEMHNEMGVKAVEYGVIGEILFWTLEKCVGEEAFTVDVHMAWIHVMSRILKTMVPVALKFELERGSNNVQLQRTKMYEELSEQIANRSKNGVEDEGDDEEGENSRSMERSRQKAKELSVEREKKADELREKEHVMRAKVQAAEDKLKAMMKQVEEAELALEGSKG
jgi:hemoglobin-like flavoprotein